MLVTFVMTGNQSDTLNCEHFNATNSSSDADKFAISTSCALFDFIVYTVAMGTLKVAMGTLTVLGVLGNAMSFVVLLRDRGRSATSFLLQALGVADSLVLLTAVPLYVLPSVYPFTGRLSSYYASYMSLMPVLWPIYLMPDEFPVPVSDFLTENTIKALKRESRRTVSCLYYGRSTSCRTRLPCW